jgi:hypothetical protein
MSVTIITLMTVIRDDITQDSNVRVSKFLKSSFTRWFFVAVSKATTLIDGVCPTDVVSLEAIEHDIGYAITKLGLKIRLADYLERVGKAQKWFTNALWSLDLSTQSFPKLDKLITHAQLRRLEDLYTGPNIGYQHNKNKLLALYEFIGMNTIHMSVPPIFPGAIELFGSPLNTAGSYCSPFVFEQTFFKSLGSFWDYQIPGGIKAQTYVANPPFDEMLIEQMADKLIYMLKSAAPSSSVCIYVTLPVWDSESQKKHGLRDFGMPFAGLTKLLKSGFCVGHEVLSDTEFQYYNYYSDRALPVSWTHFMLLQNSPGASNKFEEKVDAWRSWSAVM